MSLQEFIEKHMGLETRSYSGRGMFGKTCLGVTVSAWGEFMSNFAAALGQHPEHAGELSFDLSTALSDNMGMDTIIYFPDVPFEAEYE